jgi:DNA-directed RNA polymerase specialized sigma24 family protein
MNKAIASGSSIPKCLHGVYICTTDRGIPLGEDISENCEVCKYLYPGNLDRKFGVPRDAIPVPGTLNSAYALWLASNKSEQAYDYFFPALVKFASAIAYSMFKGDRAAPDYHETTLDAVAAVLRDHLKFDESKAAFATWAHKKIQSDLIDWKRALEMDTLSLDDPSYPIDVPDTHIGPDEKVFLSEVKALLTRDELELFEMKAHGLTIAEMAVELNQGHATVERHYAALKEKIRTFG